MGIIGPLLTASCVGYAQGYAQTGWFHSYALRTE